MSSKQKIKLSVLEGIVREIVKTLAKEMSGTAAASPVTGPKAFVKKKFTEIAEPDDTERAVDTTRKSNCCGAPPAGEIARDNAGRCSKCKDGAMFSGGKKKVKENEFDGKKWPKHNAKISPEEMEEAKNVAAKIWQPVYLTQLHSTSLDGKTKFFVVYLHSYTGDKHYMYKDANGKWFYAKGHGAESKFVPADEYLTETVTGDVSGFQVPGWVSRKGGSKAGVAGSAALGYELTPMGKKEMQRTGDKLLESQQAALGKKFGKAQRSYDAMSEPEPERERNCKLDGHDWTVRAYRDPNTGILSTWKQCDHCKVTTNPTVHPSK